MLRMAAGRNSPERGRLVGASGPARPVDRPFDAGRRPYSARISRLVDDVVDFLQREEERLALRKRRRRATDQARLHDTVAALICDALHREMTCPRGWLSISLSKSAMGTNSRQAAARTKTLPTILLALSPGVLDVVIGSPKFEGTGRRTTFRLSAEFAQRYAAALKPGDFCRMDAGQLIVLKGPRQKRGSAPLIAFQHSPELTKLQNQVADLNGWFAGFEIELDECALPKPHPDLTDRLVRRYFSNGRFDHGGRLFGGFWLSMRKQERRALRLSGEPVVALDYRQMAPRLLYARARATPPDDCYAVPGYRHHREGWKKLLNALLFDGDARERMPQGIRSQLPSRMSYEQAKHLLLAHNHSIAHLIRDGVGFELMFAESELMIATLFALRAQDVPALPVHDGLLVGYDASIQAASTMRSAFLARTGQPGELTMDDFSGRRFIFNATARWELLGEVLEPEAWVQDF